MEKQDATLVNIIHGEMQNAQVVVFDDEKKLIVSPHNNNLLNKILHIKYEIRQIERGIEPNYLMRRLSEEYLESVIDKASDVYNPEIVEIFMNGRIRIFHILDTPGGASLISNVIENASKEAKERGCAVTAYVYNQAASAGAMIFETATQSFVLRNSEFLWHLSSHSDEDQRKVQMENIRAFFRQKCKPEYLEVILKRIDEAEEDPENDRNDVVFTAEELFEFGIVSELFSDVTSLHDHFIDESGVMSEAIFNFYFNQQFFPMFR